MREHKGRLNALGAWAQVWATWPGFLWGSLVVGGGYSLGYAIWAVRFRSFVDRMIADRFERPRCLSVLAWYVGAGITVALAWWAVQSYRCAAREDCCQEEIVKQARWPSALTLLLPLMAIYWQVRNQGWRSVSLLSRVGVFVATLGVVWMSGIEVPTPSLSWIRERFSPRWVIAVALVIAVGLGWVGIMRHRSFNSTALDMAMMDQVVWNTARGRLLQGTLASSGRGVFLAHHFSPILAVLAPLYWFAAFPETLIVVQAVAIALSALCLYAIGSRLTGHRWLAACLSASLLLNPSLHQGALFDFHQDALGMLFMLFGLMCVAHKRWAWAIAGWLLSLLCKEELAIYWAATALFLSILNKKWRWVYAAGAMLNVAWLLTVVYVVIPAFAPSPGGSFALWGRYQDFGSTLTELVMTCVTNPIYVLRNMLSQTRIVGVTVLVLPVIFLLWQGLPETLILLAPLAINLLSGLGAQHRFSVHYSMLPLAAVYAAALQGAGKRRSVDRTPAAVVSRLLDRRGVYVLVASLILYVFFSPLGLRVLDTVRDFQRDAHDAIGTQIVRGIPPEASVVAQNTLVPHLSQREIIQRFPSRWLSAPHYYVFDVTAGPHPLSPKEYRQAVSEAIHRPGYGPVRVQDGYIVLERDAERGRVAEALAMLDAMGPLPSE